MKVEHLKASVTAAATSTAILFIWLTFSWQEHSVLFLSIEVILLPSIYILGNLLTEQTLRAQHLQRINDVEEHLRKLNEKYYKLRTRYYALRSKVDAWGKK